MLLDIFFFLSAKILYWINWVPEVLNVQKTDYNSDMVSMKHVVNHDQKMNHIMKLIQVCGLDSYPRLHRKPSLIFEDHWLKWDWKPFSKCLSQVHNKNTASSIILFVLKVLPEKIMLFLCFQMDHVNANHHHFHLVAIKPSYDWCMCWIKCCLGCCGKTTTIFTQDKDSHQSGSTLLQWKNRWLALSSTLLQKGHK